MPCSYGAETSKEEEPSSPKRRKTDISSSSTNASPAALNKLSPKEQKSEARDVPLEPDQEHVAHQSQGSPSTIQHSRQRERPRTIDLSNVSRQRVDPVPPHEPGRREAPSVGSMASRVNNNPDHAITTPADEEAVVYNSTRMLQDPTGRLLYVGDAATLSFLQLMRMIVDNVVGPTPFTLDPRRHRIVEGTSSLPTNFRRTHLLPDQQTAQVLVEAYFTNVISVPLLDLSSRMLMYL